MKKSEICIIETTNIKFHDLCKNFCKGILAKVLDDIFIIKTNYSNYWEATCFVLDDTHTSRIPKVQIVTSFLYAGGNDNFDGHLYSAMSVYEIWTYLADRRFISADEYNTSK